MSDKIEQFKAITGANESVSKFYIESAGGNLDVAIDNYFKFTRKSNEDNTIRSLSDILSKDETKKDDRNQYYAGSGQQIIGDTPDKKIESEHDLVKNIFEKAKEHGAKSKHEWDEENKKEKPKFTGTGRRLGVTLDDDVRVEPKKKEEKKEEKQITITFWKTGFSIDDGELRPYNDPKNKEFLDAINKGYVPREIAQGAREVMVNLVDRKSEDYTPPPKVFKPFEGSGRTLGSQRPTQTIQPPISKQPFKLHVDESKPTTTITIRCHDGSRIVQKFNLDHTVSDLYKHVEATDRKSVV